MKTTRFSSKQAGKGKSGRLKKPKPQLLALEPRFMFDGAAVATAVESAPDITAHEAAPTSPDAYQSEPAKTDIQPAAVPTENEAAARKEIVFVDTTVADWQSLVMDVRQGVEVVLLDGSKDAFAQMAERLAGVTDLDAIHVVSHGSPGELIIAGTSYGIESLNSHADELATIGRALSADGDLLLYGCDLADGGQGDALIDAIAKATGADVAASTDTTGSARVWQGDWDLEKQSGEVSAGLFASAESLENYENKLATVSLTGASGWTTIMYGPGKDPHGDSQAGAADTDIIGDATHGSLYTAYDDNGTATNTDDTLVFRMRIDNPTSTTNFAGVAIVGMDANLDGRIDMFMSVDGRNNGQAIRLFDPGTGANISPSTTTTSALPTGWLPNNGIYSFTASNYSVAAVSSLNDPHWDGDADVGNDGKADAFITWRIPIADLQIVLAKPSTVDRNGLYGPRGSTGIANYDQNTVVQYVSFTQTQTGPINGDLNGVGPTYDKNATFASLGAFTAPMSAINPVGAATGLVITDNASGTATGPVTFTFKFSEGVNGFDVDDINITGGSKGTFTAVSSSEYTLVVSPDAGVDNGSIQVSVASGAAQSIAGSLPTAAGSADQAYDTLAPTVTVDTPSTALSGKPVLTGTSNLPDGSMVTVTLDTDNNSATANLVYQVMVSGGLWSLNTATLAPVSGTMPSGGLTSYTKVTATATDAAGNSSSAIELNRPTVNTLSTNDTTPVISGTWTNIPGDVLTVTVNGATYTLTPSGNTWTIDLGSAVPTSGTLGAFASGNSYEVTATVTRASSNVSDTSTAELTITSTPVKTIDITGDATASGSNIRPVISGTSGNAGGFVIVRLDPNNDGNLSDAVTYSVTTAGDGSWTLDTATATPISGTVPAGGFAGVTGIVATDSTGAVSDTQVLTISTPTVAIGSISSAAVTDGTGVVNNTGAAANYLNMREDDSVTISGTATGASSVDLTIRDANGHLVTVSGIAVTAGAWSASGLNLSSLDNGTLTVTATISGTAIQATNTSVAHDKLAPRIFITNPSEIKKNGGIIYGGSELPNTQLTVTVRDSADTTTVWTGTVATDANGDWTVTTSGNLVSGNSGNVIVKVQPTATATDTAGNIAQQASKSQYVAANASTNTISIGTIAGDNQITVGEIGTGVVISGTTTLTVSTTVNLTVTDGTTTINLTTTASSGTWSATLSNAQIKSLSNGPLTVTATAVDGNITISDNALPSLTLPSPTLTITDNVPGTASGDVVFTFSFSDGVTGFTASDITVTNGTKGTFTSISATEYTLVVTPTAASSGTIQVSVADSIAAGNTTGRNNVGATAAQAFNTTGAAAAPSVTIDIDNLASDATPVITGTTSLPAGAPIVVSIDTDNNGVADLTYSAIVQSGGSWSVDIGSATPVSGTLPAEGLPAYAKITATGTNAYGNSTTATGQNTPTVTTQVTNDNTPSVSGTWTNVSGDVLTVVVNGVTYSAANGNLTVGANTWSLTAGTLADNTYSVNATVSRSGTTRTDTTSAELVIDTAASVDISGGAAVATNDATPVISGTTADIPPGALLTLSIDTDNNGSYDLVYKTSVQANGSWAIDTASAIPFSGTFPVQGLKGTMQMTASAADTAGNSGNDVQTLIVDVTPPEIALTFNAKTADTTPVITGTSDLPSGSTITVEIDPNNDGDWSDKHTYATTVSTDGTWSVEAASPLSGTIGVKATGTDAVGNTTTTVVKPLQIVSSAPGIDITSPIASIGVDNIANASEDDAVVLAGSTANVATGSTITVTITDGTITITDTATVQNDGSWALAALNLSAMASGKISVTAEVTDTDGSVYHDTASFTHDKSATVAIDSISEDTGTPGDFVTRDSTISFQGSATPNTSVTISVKDSSNVVVASFSVTSTADGTWTTAATGTLAAGNYLVEASVGGTPVSKSMTVVDATAPTLTASTPADNATGIAVGSNITLTFSKDVHAGSGFVALYRADGTLIENFNVATGAGDAGGSISFNGTTGVTINPGSDLTPSTGYYLTIGTETVLDQGGNPYAGISSPTTLNFTAAGLGDTTAPAAPGIDLLTSSDSGASNSDNITRDDTPTLRVSLNGSGAAAPVAGDIVKLFDGATEVGSATLSSADLTAGFVDITTSGLNSGTHNLAATVTDASSNQSTASATLSALVDTAAPGLSAATVNGSTLTLSYTEAGAGLHSTAPSASDYAVKVNGSSVSVSNVAVDTTAKTLTLSLAAAVFNGDSVSVSYTPSTSRVQDIAANEAVALTNQTVTNNTAAVTPTQSVSITAVTDDIGSITGSVASGGSTDDIAPSVSGTISAGLHTGEVVKVYRDGTAVGNATVSGTNWTFADSSLSNGSTYSYTARVENGALQGTASSSYGITIDNSAAAPSVSLTNDTGASGSNFITGNGSLQVSGTEAGATIQYSTDGTNWTTGFTPTEGSNTVYVRQIDSVGNISASSSALSFTLDTIAPVIGSAMVNANTLVLAYAESNFLDAVNVSTAGALTVLVDGNSVTVTSLSVDAANRTMSLTLATAVEAGQTVSVSYTDPTAGNDVHAVQDRAGNDAASFSGRAVTNNTPAAPVPSPVVTLPIPKPPVQEVPKPVEAPANAAPVSPIDPVPVNPVSNAVPIEGINASAAVQTQFMSLERGSGIAMLDTQRVAAAADLGNILTSRGEHAFQITVKEASEPSLMRFRGIPDQEFSATGNISIQIPVDAFVHTNAKAVVRLSARMANGEPMPKWLRFDATTGKFSGEPPGGAGKDLVLMVEARDDNGRRAEAMFHIKMAGKRAEGRSSLGEQFKAANRQAANADRLQLGARPTR